MSIVDVRLRPLPIVPEGVLVKHRVFEEFDHRFRACARLLQALWRERKGLPIGSYQTAAGRTRRMGSLIGIAAATAGRNFLSPDIAEIARRATIYQEPGALIDKCRLYGNLLSSMPLAFNLFGLMQRDLGLAERVCRLILPGREISRVVQVRFEHSPGRKDLTLTADRTAFDVAILYERPDGRRGFIGIEVKYSESMWEPAPPELSARYGELAPASGLYKNPADALLRRNPLQQLFREHLLTYAGVARGDWAEASYVLIAPARNNLVQAAAKGYQAHLIAPDASDIPFVNIALEKLIEGIGSAGAPEAARDLFDRYCDFDQVDVAIEEALRLNMLQWESTEQLDNRLPLADA